MGGHRSNCAELKDCIAGSRWAHSDRRKKSRYMWTMRLALVYAEIKNAKSTIRSAVRSQKWILVGWAAKRRATAIHVWKSTKVARWFFKGIVSKKWVAFALRTAMSRKGRGMGTETKDEVRAPLRDSLGAGTVIAADRAKTWQSLAKEIKKPILRGISQACLGSWSLGLWHSLCELLQGSTSTFWPSGIMTAPHCPQWKISSFLASPWCASKKAAAFLRVMRAIKCTLPSSLCLDWCASLIPFFLRLLNTTGFLAYPATDFRAVDGPSFALSTLTMVQVPRGLV